LAVGGAAIARAPAGLAGIVCFLAMHFRPRVRPLHCVEPRADAVFRV